MVVGQGHEQSPVTGFHGLVEQFKKDLLERTLRAYRGNRTHTARALGLQRTYLIRLIKLFQIDVPARGSTPNGTRDC